MEHLGLESPPRSPKLPPSPVLPPCSSPLLPPSSAAAPIMATLHEEPLNPAGRAIPNMRSLDLACAESPDLEGRPLSPMSCIEAVIAIRGGLGPAAAEPNAEAEAAALESLAEANPLEPKKL